MFIIYDKVLNKSVGITETSFDVTLISADYELRAETPELLAEFNAYKEEIAPDDAVPPVEPPIEE